MELVFNLTLIFHNQLTPSLYYYLYTLYIGKQCEYTMAPQALKELEEHGWIKISADGPILRGQFLRVFKKYLEVDEVDKWIDEWRNLWPASVKTGGRPVKGSKAGCLKKMKSFTSKNPQYSKENIFSATKAYLFDKSREGFKFIVSADYFIEKDSVSLLEALLEHYEERGTALDNMAHEGGAFHKEI